MLTSTLREGVRVPFPKHIGERRYMQPFTTTHGLGRWRDTVDAMLEGIEVPRVAYLMVDQGFVLSGSTHRRGGLHVDGNWLSDIQCHGQPVPPSHRHGHDHPPSPGHLHAWDHAPTWSHFDYEPELVILATDVSACQAFVGEVDGQPDSQGGCDHLDILGLDKVRLDSHKAFILSASTLHESLPVARDCLRTVVRLNIPLQ